MPDPVINLSNKIRESGKFNERFLALQKYAAKKRLTFSAEDATPEQLQKLILQASVLALSDDIEHKRTAQKIMALFHEIKPDNHLLSYAIQILASRLGNFPVVSNASTVFGESKIFKDASDEASLDTEYLFDPEIIANLYSEEAQSRLQIQDKVYHFNIFQKEILDALSEKALVSFSAPTSFGKSFIVRQHIAHLYAGQKVKRVLVLVPTKSLIDDFFADFVKIKRELNLDFGIFTHARSVDAVPEKAVFILTQERISFLITKNPEFVKSFDLIYCDEAHYISRGYRGFVLRSALKKLIELCGVGIEEGKARYIFSSPLIKNPEYYKGKLFPLLSSEQSFHKEILYSPVEKNIHFIAKEERQFKYYLLKDSFGEDSFDDRLEELGSRNFPQGLMTEDTRAQKIDREIRMVLDCSGTSPSILYTTSPIFAHRYALALAEARPERNRISSQEIEDLSRYIKDHYDDNFGLVNILKKGIGLHYGPMPTGLRRAMVDLFERGLIDYMVCTPTLLEGVNLPAKNIFLFSDRYGGHGGKEKHSALSFWNLVGRAGRITYGLSGNVFCIEDEPQKYEDLFENTETEITDPEANVMENDTRRSYIVKTFLSETDRFDYFRSHSRGDIEYLIFELLTRENPERILDNFNLNPEEKARMLAAIQQQRAELSISLELVNKNPGIDPRLQDRLLANLRSLPEEELRGYLEIPGNTLAVTGSQLADILGYVKRDLAWPKRDESRTANRIIQWLHEHPISFFINQVLQYIEPGSEFDTHLGKIEKAIEILREVDRELSYNAPKYLKCFYDLLIQIAAEQGIADINIYEEKIESFLFSLESGVSSVIAKFLLEKGVSRPVAIRVSSLVDDIASIPISNDFFEKPEVLERLSRLSKLALDELKERLGV